MKKQNHVFDALQAEQEAGPVAALVRKGLSQIEGPSPRVLQAIHDEAAARALSRRPAQMPLFRALAAAASLLILLGGAVQYHLNRQAGHHAQTLQLVLHIGAPQAASGPVNGTAELASRLLSIQGLDEETFFTPDETEVLSL